MKKPSALQTVATFALTAAVIAFTAPASAQFQKPEDAVKYRQSVLTVMGTHFGRIGAMVNGRAPFDAKVAQDSAHVVARHERLAMASFHAKHGSFENTCISLKFGKKAPSSKKPARSCRQKLPNWKLLPKPVI